VSLRDRLSKYLEWWRSCFNQLVAIDVCDSDRMSDYAVSLLNQADKVIVPSNYCVEVYRSSGVKRPVYRVPHGVDPDWYTAPNTWEALPLVLSVKKVSPVLVDLYVYKTRKNKRFLLFWLWHSEARKGWFEVREFYSRLVRERGDVVLVLKTVYPHSPAFQEVMHLGTVQVYGWLSEYEKMALYDLADVTLVFSRGGGFEHNALESLARGVPVVTSNSGSWTDYVPQFLQVKAGERVKVFEHNAIHVGYGYKVDVEDALNKIHDILENYDDYRARVEEWRSKVLFNEYRWDIIAKRLVETIHG
jgi:glycosyltransferase involved in cell wall biosynthesis